MGYLFRRRKADGTLASVWTGEYRDADDRLVRRAFGKDESRAKVLLARAEKDADDIRQGIVERDPYADYRTLSLSDHLRDYRQSLADDSRSETYIQTTAQRIGAIFQGCRFRSLADLRRPDAAAKIKAYLARRSQTKGTGKTSLNHYIGAIRSFCRWLHDAGRLQVAPLGNLRKVKVTDADLVHVRRTISPADLQRLLRTTYASDVTVTGRTYRMTGYHRYVLYLLASQTGLRASELAGLRVSSLDLEADPPTVQARAAIRGNKAGREVTLPLHPRAADVLRAYIDGRSPKAHLWPGRWAAIKRAGKILKPDLKAANIDYETDDGFFDFHSLRCQFVTSLVMASVPIKITQQLARHADPSLTMRAYAKADALKDGASYIQSMTVPTIDDPPQDAPPMGKGKLRLVWPNGQRPSR